MMVRSDLVGSRNRLHIIPRTFGVIIVPAATSVNTILMVLSSLGFTFLTFFCLGQLLLPFPPGDPALLL